MRVQSLALPAGAMLASYRDRGAYTDCFAIEIDKTVSQADFIIAFYTSPLFKIERLILKWLVAKPSADSDVVALAQGKAVTFAAWSVESRTTDQILMCDYQTRTLSWLMAEALDNNGATRLYFGTAVMPTRPNGKRDRIFGTGFRILLGFHKLYARSLLKTAAARLCKGA